MPSNLRPPAVAGRFYPQEPQILISDIQSYLSPREEPTSAIGCMVPHAGYMYSGQVAGAVFTRIKIPGRVIVLCPNHTGRGRPLAIMSEGEWETPIGKVSIDFDLADTLKQRFSALNEDSEAHRSEHAIEVELPFLLAIRQQFAFVPIALGTAQYELLHGLGEAIADVVAAQSEPTLVIASSDMNHYENDQVTRIKDHKAIDRISQLDEEGLFKVVMNEEISMCGFGPAVAMITAAKRLGATRAELVKYATSGDVSGDRDMVVGYAGVVVR